MMLVLLAALPLPSSAAARPAQQLSGFGRCGTTEGDDWFVEELAVAPLTITPGAAVEPPEGDQDGASTFARITNTTSTPLYLVELFSGYGFQGGYAAATPISLEADLIVTQRVVFGAVERWVWSGRPSQAGWHSANTEVISANRDQVMQLLPGYRSEQRWEDDRPADVAIPQPITYTLRVIYGDELFDIPVTQSYRLNPHYDPNQDRNAQAKCNSRRVNLIEAPLRVLTTAADLVHGCFRMMLLILVTVILFALVRMARRYWCGR
jgi:hypothetical protein